MHEHWYDEWVFLSASTDEYFAFSPGTGSMLPQAPVRPTPLVHEYLTHWVDLLTKPGRKEWMPIDPLGRRENCPPAACFPLRHYVVPGSEYVYNYEDPAKDPAHRAHKRVTVMKFNSTDIASSRLAFEERTFRNPSPMKNHGSNRKCAYHPDWRSMGPRTSIHGMIPEGCPSDSWLVRSRTCTLQDKPEFRALCWELCGVWGEELRLSFPRSSPSKSSLNNSCVNNDGMKRYETQMTAAYRGGSRTGSHFVPACQPDSPPDCIGPILERAHMRGEGASPHGSNYSWLLQLAPTVKDGLQQVFHRRRDLDERNRSSHDRAAHNHKSHDTGHN